jgi:hypothetical protein
MFEVKFDSRCHALQRVIAFQMWVLISNVTRFSRFSASPRFKFLFRFPMSRALARVHVSSVRFDFQCHVLQRLTTFELSVSISNVARSSACPRFIYLFRFPKPRASASRSPTRNEWNKRMIISWQRRKQIPTNRYLLKFNVRPLQLPTASEQQQQNQQQTGAYIIL